MVRLRHEYLKRQLSSLRARVRMLKGERLSFDEESKALYDAVAPTHPESHFQQILDRSTSGFRAPDRWSNATTRSGAGSSSRATKLDAVFQTAIKAAASAR